MISSRYSAEKMNLYRVIAVALIVGLVAHTTGVSWVFAGSSVVRGKVVLQVGTPPPTGSMVQATPLNGGETQFASVGENGTYIFSELPEGEYQFDVVGPDGTIFEPGSGLVQTLVPSSGISILNMDVISTGLAVAPPAGQEPEQEKKSKRKVVWWVVGGVVAAVAIIALAGEGSESSPEDPPMSPAAP